MKKGAGWCPWVTAFRQNPVKAENRRNPLALRQNHILKEFLVTLKPEEKSYEVMDTKLSGFGVRVSPKGKIAYIIRWSLRARDGRETIGAFPKMPVAAGQKAAGLAWAWWREEKYPYRRRSASGRPKPCGNF